MKIKHKILLFIALVAFGALSRFIPHFWNMTPVGSLAFLAGAKLGFGWALLLPILTMVFSDPFLGYYSLPIMISVYFFFTLYGVSGFLSRKTKNFGYSLAGVAGSSLLFFIFTNMAVWYWGTMYTHDLSGLILSYLMALPFFWNQILGDIFFASALFLIWESVLVVLNNYKKESNKIQSLIN